MKTKVVIIMLVMFVAAVAFYQTSNITQAADEVSCTVNFDASIRTGPDAGWTLKGNLVLTVDPTGSATGVLTQADGSDVKAVGQVNGRAINLAFDLGQDMYIFGVGTLTNTLSECTGQVGGPFAGPKAGDLGDWGYAIGGRAAK